MLLISLNPNGHLILEPYSIDKSYKPYGTTKVLKSNTLSAAFLVKHQLCRLFINLVNGYKILLPDFLGYNESNLVELRQFRYNNQHKLKFQLHASKFVMPEILVYSDKTIISLEAYLLYQQELRFDKIINEFNRKIIYLTKDAFYFTGTIYCTTETRLRNQFNQIGYLIIIEALDSNISKLTFTKN